MSQSPQAKDISRSSNWGSHSACDCGVSIELPQKYRLCLAEVLARDREELEAKGWPLRLEDEWWARICDTLWYAIIYIYIEDLTLMVTGNHMKHTNTIFRKTCVSIGTWIFDLTCLLYGTITGRFMVPTSSQIVWSSGQSATQAVRLQQESCRSIKECGGKQTAKWWVSPDWTMFNYRKKMISSTWVCPEIVNILSNCTFHSEDGVTKHWILVCPTCGPTREHQD